MVESTNGAFADFLIGLDPLLEYIRMIELLNFNERTP
jgi:hypothetical protein